MKLNIGDFVATTSIDGGNAVSGIFCIVIEQGIIMVTNEQGDAFRCSAKHTRVIPDSQLSASTLEFAHSFRRKKAIEVTPRKDAPA